MDHQGATVLLEPDDVRELIELCQFESEAELRFYMRSLDERGLIRNKSSSKYIGGQITIDGYCYLDQIRPTDERS